MFFTRKKITLLRANNGIEKISQDTNNSLLVDIFISCVTKTYGSELLESLRLVLFGNETNICEVHFNYNTDPSQHY